MRGHLGPGQVARVTQSPGLKCGCLWDTGPCGPGRASGLGGRKAGGGGDSHRWLWPCEMLLWPVGKIVSCEQEEGW